MKKNKVLKILIAVLIFITLICVFTQPASALKFDVSEKFENTTDKSQASNHTANILGAVISITQVIGAGIAIIMLIVLAIQFFWSSPTGKAEFTKRFRVYILGAIIIFSATALLQIVKDFAIKNINNA